jgi:hypothetical protein
MPTALFWFVLCILRALNGASAMILYPQSCGNLKIFIAMTLKWLWSLAGIQFSRANVLNVVHRFRECACHLSNGGVNVVNGKMIFRRYSDFQMSAYSFENKKQAPSEF